MHRNLVIAVGTTFAGIALAGCTPNTYQTNADPNHLVAYAAKANYPYDTHSELGVHLFCTVAPDATITLFNAGDESYDDFELWVNKLYTLHVKKLDAKGLVLISPKDVFNNSASSLEGVPPGSINTVQIYVPGTAPAVPKLLDVQGPIIH